MLLLKYKVNKTYKDIPELSDVELMELENISNILKKILVVSQA